MPTISDPVSSHHETLVAGIYIARGDETLGPYTSLEAASLVAAGQLRADDYAACNGDAAWVSLAEFLPLSALAPVQRQTQPAANPAPPAGAYPQRWRGLAVAFVILLAAPLLVVASVRWLGPRRSEVRAGLPVVAPPLVVPSAAPDTPSVDLPSTVVASLPPVPEVAQPEVSGPLQGSLAFLLPTGGSATTAGVQVSAFPLASIAPGLEAEDAVAQAARAKLDPQIEAATLDRTARAAEAQAASQALREARSSDPMLPSLRFANQGAKTAARTAEDDYRFLLAERASAAGGDVYFRGLPESTLTAETDAQGNFSLTFPPDDSAPYAVAVRARQTSEDGAVRWRYWLVRLSPAQQAGRERLRLDDGNASTSDAAESLIHTAD